MYIVAIGVVIGFFEGVTPDVSVSLRNWVIGNVASTLAVAILFFAVATQSLTESLRQTFATLGVYTLLSILIGLALSAWVVEPLIMAVVDWLAVVLGALAGTVVGVWVRMVKGRLRAMSAPDR